MMETITKDSEIPTCKFLGCEQPIDLKWDINGTYCDYHRKGGVFGSGESYEQYQIIEQDFIDFIKAVPLTTDHFKVYSPVLRDIIIRVCIQVEIFFKEWAKEDCIEHNNSPFWKKYNELGKNKLPKKEKNWTIKDYFYFSPQLNPEVNLSYKRLFSIHVMPLNQNIYPFTGWTIKEPPAWWDVYNGIKHSGFKEYKKSNLENALYALAGLFLMHCTNYSSGKYLQGFNLGTVRDEGFGKITVIQPDLTTPMDSKKYLFKSNAHYSSRRIELVTKEELGNRLNPNNRSRI